MTGVDTLVVTVGLARPPLVLARRCEILLLVLTVLVLLLLFVVVVVLAVLCNTAVPLLGPAVVLGTLVEGPARTPSNFSCSAENKIRVRNNSVLHTRYKDHNSINKKDPFVETS